MSNNQLSPGAVGQGRLPTAWIAGGVLAVVSIAAAATIALRPAATSGASPVAPSAATQVAAQPAPAEPAVVAKPVTAAAARPAPRPAKPPVADTVAKVSSVCGHCGVVESVVAVKRKGEATGLGVVAGGVLGAVVGHQMGNGSGKKAMTVLGGVAGGVAGHEVEKRARSETVYQVQLRMDDGSKRTLTLGSAQVAKGDRVAVEGQNLRRLQS